MALSGAQFAGILMYLKTSNTLKELKSTELIGSSGKKYSGSFALASFYGSDYYSLAFGTATVFLNSRNRIVGFHDTYDFDPKKFKERSLKNEVKTRAVRAVSPKTAKSFSISYGYQN